MMNFFNFKKSMEDKEHELDMEFEEITDEMRREMAAAKEEQKWEQRRYEVARLVALQDRRSVVLGKLHASNEGIARNARRLADALIAELRRKNEEVQP